MDEASIFRGQGIRESYDLSYMFDRGRVAAAADEVFDIVEAQNKVPYIGWHRRRRVFRVDDTEDFGRPKGGGIFGGAG